MFNQLSKYKSKRDKKESAERDTCDHSKWLEIVFFCLDGWMLNYTNEGFEKTVIRETTEATHRIDKFNQTSVLYIYSDVAAPSIVGDIRANLLQCVPVTGNYGEMIRQSFNPIRYVPLLYDTIDSIRIEILSEQKLPINFSYGSVVLTLHITNC